MLGLARREWLQLYSFDLESLRETQMGLFRPAREPLLSDLACPFLVLSLGAFGFAVVALDKAWPHGCVAGSLRSTAPRISSPIHRALLLSDHVGEDGKTFFLRFIPIIGGRGYG